MKIIKATKEVLHKKKCYQILNGELRADLPSFSSPLPKHSKLLSFIKNFAKLGSGSFGKVFLARKELYKEADVFDVMTIHQSGLSLQEEFVIKIINFSEYSSVITEVESLSTLIHPNIVSCYNVWQESPSECGTDEWNMIKEIIATQFWDEMSSLSDDGSGTSGGLQAQNNEHYLCLQFEYCDGGTLENLLDQWIASSREDEGYLVMQVLEGLLYLQVIGVVHGDLNPSNIFVQRTPQGGRYLAKIGDFGLSILNKNNNAGSSVPSFNNNGRYHAPEVGDSRLNRSHKSDMFAFGLILMQIVSADLFQDGKDRRSKVQQASVEGMFPEFVKNMMEYKWIQKLVSKHPEDRPSAGELKEIMIQTERYGKSQSFHGNPPPYNETKALISSGIGISLINDKKDYKQGYRYLCSFFYDYLSHVYSANTVAGSTPQYYSDIEWNLQTVAAIDKISLQLDRLPDQCYRLLQLIPIVSRTFGSEHLLTLDFKQALLSLYYTNQRQSSPHSFPSTQKIEFWIQLEASINNSPTFQALPATDRLKSAMFLLFVSKVINSLEKGDPKFNEGMQRALAISYGLCQDFQKILGDLEEADTSSEDGQIDDQQHQDFGLSTGDNADDEMEQEGATDQEMEHISRRGQQISRFPSDATIIFQIINCRFNVALIHLRLDEVDKARVSYKLLLEFFTDIYENKLETFELTPIIFSEYATFVMRDVSASKLYSALIYAMAACQIFEELNNQVAENYDFSSCVAMLLQSLGMKEDLKRFILHVVANSERENRLFMTAATDSRRGNLNSNLISDQEILVNFQKQMETDYGYSGRALEDTYKRVVEGSEVVISTVKDLLESPPKEVMEEGKWMQEVLDWARKLYGKF
ncbi:uncharacterized protein LOC118433110 isoform X1 [Folsomia candida]|nr:uncharacterized protein LOC118433110 isoform X1 [Folsomia candida]XP_035700603.1 uncharacterized protein LOC118433110 isoform X1 [Folsomia candida]